MTTILLLLVFLFVIALIYKAYGKDKPNDE